MDKDCDGLHRSEEKREARTEDHAVCAEQLKT